jgi:hypothetical protein
VRAQRQTPGPGCRRSCQQLGRTRRRVEWAEWDSGPEGVFPFYFIRFFYSLFHVQDFYSNLNSCLNFKFPSVQINTNVRITSIVYNVIIYSFPCYLLMGGINGFIKILFPIFCL